MTPTTTDITLEHPLKRGEQTIAQITVRKPGSGELRGCSLIDLLRMDVYSLHVVLPRITSPTLTRHDVGQLDPADLMQLGTAVTSFFAAEVGQRGRLPERIEDAIADVAVIFHWPPEAMYAMGVAELMAWRERAYERSGADE